MTYKTLPKPSTDNKQVHEYVAAAKHGLNGQFVTKTSKGWNVRSVSATKADDVFATKDEAIKRAREIARSQKGEVYIFDAEGKLTGRSSSGD